MEQGIYLVKLRVRKCRALGSISWFIAAFSKDTLHPMCWRVLESVT